MTINLSNLNDNAPAITAGQSYRIDGGAHNSIGKVLATDPDDTNQPGFTTFSGWTITSGNTNNVFRFSTHGHLAGGASAADRLAQERLQSRYDGERRRERQCRYNRAGHDSRIA